MSAGTRTATAARRRVRRALAKYGRTISLWRPTTQSTVSVTAFACALSRNQFAPPVFEGYVMRDEDDPYLLMAKDDVEVKEGDIATIDGYKRVVARVDKDVLANTSIVQQALLIRYGV